MNKSIKKVCLNTVIILFAGILCGALLLTLAYCIPVNWNSVYSTERSVEQQGYYPNVPIITNAYNTYFQTWLPGVLDNATVRTFMLPMTFEIGDNPLFLAMNCRGYNHYWHGYVTILRVLQLFMNYEEIQIANEFLQIALITLLAVLIGRKKGVRYVVMLISCYALLMPMAISTCIQYSAVFYLAYGACLFLIWKQKWLNQGYRLFYFFLIIGMLTSYFDLLTYPLLTWGIPMIWWVILENRETSVLAFLKKIVIHGIAWILGYGGMWFGKWILATIVLQENIIVKALYAILLRANVEDQVTFGQSNRLYALYMNWKHYTYKLYVLILLIWLLYWLASGFFKGWKKTCTAKCCSFLLIGCSSFAWYLVLMNHTETHHAFTYRIFGISIAAFFAIILESTSHTKMEWKGIRHYISFFATGILLMMIACLFTLCTREITPMDNKDQEFESKVLEGEQAKFCFIPAHDRIIAIGIGLQTNSNTGWYEISVYDGESRLYEETIPVTYYNGNNYENYNVDWHLTAGKEYTISVTTHEIDGDVNLYYTADGFLPLDGCQYYDGDSLIPSQPLLGIQYWCLPLSFKTKFLLTLTYWGLLWTIFYVAACVKVTKKK